MAITFICCYAPLIQADITWTDADFTSSKGETYLQNTTVNLNNSNQAEFNAYPSYDRSVLTLENSIFTAQGDVKIVGTGPTSDALLIFGGSTHFKGNLFTAITNPNSTYYVIGVRGDNSLLTVDGETTILGGQAGLYLEKQTATVIFNDKLTIDIDNATSGIVSNGDLTLADTSIHLSGRTDGDVTTAIKAGSGSITTANGALSIKIDLPHDSTKYQYGIYNQGQMDLKDTQIIFDATYDTSKQAGIYNTNAASSVTIDGNLSILTNNPYSYNQYAIYSTNNATVESINSIANIQGHLYASNNATIDLQMKQGSAWTGASHTTTGGIINIDMDNTQWNMTTDSMLNKLEANNSNIRFAHNPASAAGTPNFFELSINQLSGSDNHFYMTTDLGSITSAVNADGERVGQAGFNGDLLTISNTNTSTNNTITIQNVGATITQGNEVLQIVATPINQTGNFKLSSLAEAGGYLYDLRQTTNAANDPIGWELYGTGKTTSTAKTSINGAFNAPYLVSYVEMQALLQRMGELRQNNNNLNGNFWIRTYGGKLNSFSGQKLDGFDMTYTGTQLGLDKQIHLNAAELYLGLMAGYTHANPDYKEGSGTTKSFTTGLYATYLSHNGFYTDTVIKYTHIRNKFSVKNTQNEAVKGIAKTDNYGLSLEIGKQFKLGNSHFYIEPQAQLAYQYQDSSTVKASNGLTVKLDSYDSLIGRASTILGYTVSDNNNLKLDLYAKTGVVHEFLGKTNYKLNGSKEKYSFEGSWIDNTLGVSAKLNSGHSFYGEVGYATGRRFDKMQANIGYRYQF